MCWVFVSVRGLSLVAVSGGHSSSQCGGHSSSSCEGLTIAASLVAEHRLQTRRLSSCGSRAQLLRGMWDLPRPGLEPVSPALASGFSTTAPPGKPSIFNNIYKRTNNSFSPYGKCYGYFYICKKKTKKWFTLNLTPLQLEKVQMN